MTGHNEDAATGVAAAALSSQFNRSIFVRQGHALGDPCKITVYYKNQDSILVGGRIGCLDLPVAHRKQ